MRADSDVGFASSGCRQSCALNSNGSAQTRSGEIEAKRPERNAFPKVESHTMLAVVD
jgi:hypothetical protein